MSFWRVTHRVSQTSPSPSILFASTDSPRATLAKKSFQHSSEDKGGFDPFLVRPWKGEPFVHFCIRGNTHTVLMRGKRCEESSTKIGRDNIFTSEITFAICNIWKQSRVTRNRNLIRKGISDGSSICRGLFE